MALQFRRGTDAERQNITPKSGEPVYTTDTAKLYVGNGTTQGGQLLSANLIDDENPFLGGDLNLNNNNIVGQGNIDINGYITATGNINLGDGAEDNIIVGGVIGSSLIPDSDRVYDLGSVSTSWREGFFEGITADGEIRANNISCNKLIDQNSTILFDSDNGFFTSDFSGNVLADDSTILINSTLQDAALLTARIIDISANTLSVQNIVSQNGGITLQSESGKHTTEILSDDASADLSLLRSSDSDLSGLTSSLGRILFERTDPINGRIATSTILGGNAGLYLGNAITPANEAQPEYYLTWTDTRLGIGSFTPTETLDVQGNGIFSGNVSAAAFQGSLAADDSTIIIDSVNNTITSGGFIQFGSYTSVERDALSPVNGTVLYNTTANKFQGYQNGAWINIDDGTAA